MVKKVFFLLSCAVLASAVSAVNIPARPGKATNDVLIFPQLEAHYGDFQNFLHYWKDRPLYVNPAHRYEGNKFVYQTELSNLQHFLQAESYNIAGLSPLGGTMELLFDTAEKYDVKSKIMPGIYLPGTGSSSANAKTAIKVIKRANASSKSFRINGKVIAIFFHSEDSFKIKIKP